MTLDIMKHTRRGAVVVMGVAVAALLAGAPAEAKVEVVARRGVVIAIRRAQTVIVTDETASAYDAGGSETFSLDPSWAQAATTSVLATWIGIAAG